MTAAENIGEFCSLFLPPPLDNVCDVFSLVAELGTTETDNGVSTPRRETLWESDVLLLGEPNPELIIDATGEIVSKTYNVTVRADGVGPALNTGDVIPAGQTIVIDPMLYDEKPNALFVANHIDGVESHISGADTCNRWMSWERRAT